jgi:hypothetical protein
MAGSINDGTETRILDHIVGKTSYTMPSTVYLALFTTAVNDAGGGTEATGGSYARKLTAGSDWTAASAGRELERDGHHVRDPDRLVGDGDALRDHGVRVRHDRGRLHRLVGPHDVAGDRHRQHRQLRDRRSHAHADLMASLQRIVRGRSATLTHTFYSDAGRDRPEPGHGHGHDHPRRRHRPVVTGAAATEAGTAS